MDSMSDDLMQSLETSLAVTYFHFDKEIFCEKLQSGDIDGAESYLSAFTKSDSNFHSNMMFYFLKRQKFAMLLIDKRLPQAGAVLFHASISSIPETKDFLREDAKRCGIWGLEYERGLSGKRPPFDIDLVAKCFMDEMLQMMNNYMAMNPDLQEKKNDISSAMETLRL